MGLFKKVKHLATEGTWPQPTSEADERYPGFAGYTGVGLKKNAMPEHRFKYVPPKPEKK
jgi:hypothetical protein